MGNSFPFKKVLLKISGEILMGSAPYGIQQDPSLEIAMAIKELHFQGIHVSLVIGGGNIFRGIQAKNLGISRTSADHIGMLATLMNGIALQQALETVGCRARVLSALDCPKVVESYTALKAREYLQNGFILIFVGGTGNPYFTTDTAAALRSAEIGADALLKATKVDGVYDKDPLKSEGAKKYSRLSYSEYLSANLKVMDQTAVAMCMEQKIPILVFNMNLLKKNSVLKILENQHNGTLIEV